MAFAEALQEVTELPIMTAKSWPKRCWPGWANMIFRCANWSIVRIRSTC